MATLQDLLVGEGVQEGSPFDLNHLVYIESVGPPPTLASYGAQRLLDSVSGAEYTSIPDKTRTYVAQNLNATEGIRIYGGMIVVGAGANSVQIGQNAIAAAGGNRQVIIGTNAADGTGTTGGVAIGYNAQLRGQAGVAIGYQAQFSGLNSGIIIGDSVTTSGSGGSTSVVVIGNAAGLATGSLSGGGGVVIGGAAGANHGGSVTIGRAASATFVSNSSQNTVTIGDGAISTQIGTTVVGGAATTAQSLSVVIGSGATSTNGARSGSIVIGQLATSGGNDNIVIGRGSNCTGGSNSIVIGGGALDDIGSNVGQFGAPNSDVRTLLIGSGNFAAAPVARLVRFTNASGANIAALNATLQAPLSTGNATPGNVVISAALSAASSSVLQTPITVVTYGAVTATQTGAAYPGTSIIVMGTAPLTTGAINVDGSSYSSRFMSYKGTGGTNGYIGGSGNFEIGTSNNSILQFVTNTTSRWNVTTTTATSELVAVQATARYIGGTANGNDWRNSANTRTNSTVSDNGAAATLLNNGTVALSAAVVAASGEISAGAQIFAASNAVILSTGNAAATAGQIQLLYGDNTVFRSALEISKTTGFGTLSLMKGGGDVLHGATATYATTDVLGFLFLPTVAGAQTGVPTNATAKQSAVRFDTTNNKLWIYNQVAGAWKSIILI